MSEEDESSEKQFEASQKKLDDAHRRGDFPRSADMNVGIVYFGLFVAFSIFGGKSVYAIADIGVFFFEMTGNLGAVHFSSMGGRKLASLLQAVVVPVAALLMVPTFLLLAYLIASKSFVVAPEKIAPKLSRISLISNFKNKFGRNGIFEFLKSFVKLVVISLTLFFLLVSCLPLFFSSAKLTPFSIVQELGDIVTKFLAITALVALGIGGIDYFWQVIEHKRKNRMSRQEVQDESKQSEGDPTVKQKRRQKAISIAQGTMIQDVAEADVVIVNPTHYAVALKWDRSSARAPVCVAKGVDEIAARIREVANENAVPIYHDPPIARALYAEVEVGGEILADHYKPVAASIRFSDKMRAKVRTSFYGGGGKKK